MGNALASEAIIFLDREDAGRQLAGRLAEECFADDVLVLGLPRGGVPVAYEIAVALNAPLDVFMVRKLGAPFNPELAVGAIASGGVAIYNERLLDQLGLDEESLKMTRREAEIELERREQKYRGGQPPPAIDGKCVILVDDGIATGATMRAAVDAVRLLGAASIVVAVPTAAADSVRQLQASVDRVIALSTPEPYMAVGAWYQNFQQLSDEQVIQLLVRSRQALPAGT
jgi:predicted phosphoribosyltransferase